MAFFTVLFVIRVGSTVISTVMFLRVFSFKAVGLDVFLDMVVALTCVAFIYFLSNRKRIAKRFFQAFAIEVLLSSFLYFFTWNSIGGRASSSRAKFIGIIVYMLILLLYSVFSKRMKYTLVEK